jgi:hypothetical protein
MENQCRVNEPNVIDLEESESTAEEPVEKKQGSKMEV